jgi:SAM-dependent methyltransferase
MHEIVQDYYGKQLDTSADLKTDACCDISQVPAWLKPLLANIHAEVLSKYYGCGLVCPPLLEGCRILDLGCGSGRDVYALAQLAGAGGQVIGVDMTEEQLAVARKHLGYHADKFGFNTDTDCNIVRDKMIITSFRDEKILAVVTVEGAIKYATTTCSIRQSRSPIWSEQSHAKVQTVSDQQHTCRI